MNGQVLHRAAGLRAANLHAPAVVDEALHHVGGEGKGGVGPQVLVVVRALHLLDIVEAAHRHGVRAVRQAAQHPGHHQAEVARVVGVAERLPLDVLGAVEVVADILDGGDFLHTLFQEECRARRADKRHVRGGRDFRDVAHQRHVLGGGVKLVGRNQRGNRLAAGRVVLIDIRVPV